MSFNPFLSLIHSDDPSYDQMDEEEGEDGDSDISFVANDDVRNNDPEESESRLSDPSDVILSVYWKRGKLGASYYTCEDSQLHILNDVVDVHPDFKNLRSLFNQVQASQYVTGSGLSDIFIKTLSSLILGEDILDDTTDQVVRAQVSSRLQIMSGKRRDLNYDTCKRLILGMKLGFEPKSLKEEEHVIFLNSHIDLKQENMIISLGMLVKYLNKYLPQNNLSHDIVPIMFINHVSLENLVCIDDVTYFALQIFNSRCHPSAFKRNARSFREGLSIFGIFNRCKSSAGTKKMREIFTNPSKDIDELNLRLDTVEFCCKPQNQHIVNNMTECISKIDSITAPLSSMSGTRAKVSHWKTLYSTLYNTILLGQICNSYSDHCHLFKKIADSITEGLHEVAHHINELVDFEESTKSNQFTVRSGVDDELDRMRQTYSQVPGVLVDIAKLEIEDLPAHIEQCSIVYIPELGFLLSVPAWLQDDASLTAYELPDLEAKFVVNKFVHYKTPRCSELDNVLGDLVAMMSGVESKIMVSLIQLINSRVVEIVNAVKLVAELDCVIALAAVASENNYRRPLLVEERTLEITKGRHPLQELCVDNFVPNDAEFSFTKGIIKILTGPNASGKSVYLKQVALIAYLAHIGSFVPAERAVIGILDHIYSRIQTVESVATRMSAFMLDLKQMSYMLYNSTPSTLLVVDEFGKGTTEIDGLSLLAASLISFIERGENSPYLLVSTHFHRLPSLLPPSPLVHLQYVNYMIENEDIIYLHEIKDGTCGTSLTHFAARKAGLKEETIQRSLKILTGDKPCKANPNLKVTKNMISEIVYMKKLFELGEQGSAEMQDVN